VNIPRIQRQKFLAWIGWAVATQLVGGVLFAQQIAVSTPFNSVSDSFFERQGVNFGFSFPGGRGPGSRIVGYGPGGIQPNISFGQGGFGAAIPPFGGYDPNADARFGFARMGPNGGGYALGFQMGQGNTRSNVSTTPSIVVQNGFGGSIIDGAFVPFVTGVTPVVGGGANFVAPPDNAVTRAIGSGQLDLTSPVENDEVIPAARTYSNPQSTAQSGDLSVAAIKAARAAAIAEKQKQLDSLIKLADSHRENGEFKEARIAMREAIRVCDDDSQKKKLRQMLSELSGR
jgi:hypothetical protein